MMKKDGKFIEDLQKKELLFLRECLLNDEEGNKLLKVINSNLQLQLQNSVIIDRRLDDLTSQIEISKMYLNSRSEGALKSSNVNTIYDITRINDLTKINGMGQSSIKNIQTNMEFIERFLFTAKRNNPFCNMDILFNDLYKEKYVFIMENRFKIFRYLMDNGDEYFFSNNTTRGVNKTRNELKNVILANRLTSDQFRIVRCLADYTFADELDEDNMKCFNKFIIKK